MALKFEFRIDGDRASLERCFLESTRKPNVSQFVVDSNENIF